jgi:hypothetical protein
MLPDVDLGLRISPLQFGDEDHRGPPSKVIGVGSLIFFRLGCQVQAKVFPVVVCGALLNLQVEKNEKGPRTRSAMFQEDRHRAHQKKEGCGGAYDHGNRMTNLRSLIFQSIGSQIGYNTSESGLLIRS